MHLLLIINSLGGGGAERVLSRLANAWQATGVQVTLATFDSRDADVYHLSEGVTRRSLRDECRGQRSWLPGMVRRTRWLRTVIRASKPSAVISFIDRTNVVALLAAQGLSVPVIVSERIHPEMYDPGRIWAVLRQWVYPAAAAIVLQTHDIAEWARQRFPQSRLAVIPNPLPPDIPDASAESRPEIIAVGRLTAQKGFDLLIDAFSRIHLRWPEWRLRILGEGDARALLSQQIASLGLEQSVELAGRQADAVQQMARASIFVLSSRYEGFPNVLMEAMATGRAVIAANCRSGPADLIEHHVNGLLVPPNDVGALAEAMEQMLSSPERRIAMARAARKIRDRLAIDSILPQWNAVLSQCGCDVSSPCQDARRVA